MITKKMTLSEILSKYPKTLDVFMEYNLHCAGCAAAQFETIEQAAKAHGINVTKLIKDLNKAIKSKKGRKK
jgi:hybrid cluster-associated redox disulfide protein